MARAACVDDLRIAGEDVGRLHLEAVAGVAEEVGHEHVGFVDEAEQRFPPFWVAHVEGDVALPPIEDLPEVLDPAGVGVDAEHLDATRHVASLGMLDLDHVGAPIGKDHPALGTNAACATSRTLTPSSGPGHVRPD